MLAVLGLEGLRIDGPDQVGPVLDQALACRRPVVIDVHADRNVIALPPHATFEQAKDAALALLKGDANRWGVLKQGLITKAREVIPGQGLLMKFGARDNAYFMALCAPGG